MYEKNPFTFRVVSIPQRPTRAIIELIFRIDPFYNFPNSERKRRLFKPLISIIAIRGDERKKLIAIAIFSSGSGKNYLR
jgi:hypothetical protein